MTRGLALSLLLAAPALAGPPVQWCVGVTCAEAFAALPVDAVGELVAVDAVGNAAPQGLFCSWRGVQVSAVVELRQGGCDAAKARLEDALAALGRAGLVRPEEWVRVFAASLRGVLLYPARSLEVPRGEELVAGVYVPETGAIHLTATLEGAAHELFHAVLAARGGSIDHDAFSPVVEALSLAARSRWRGRPVL